MSSQKSINITAAKDGKKTFLRPNLEDEKRNFYHLTDFDILGNSCQQGKQITKPNFEAWPENLKVTLVLKLSKVNQTRSVATGLHGV